jgi:hypothetical protein
VAGLLAAVADALGRCILSQVALPNDTRSSGIALSNGRGEACGGGVRGRALVTAGHSPLKHTRCPFTSCLQRPARAQFPSSRPCPSYSSKHLHPTVSAAAVSNPTAWAADPDSASTRRRRRRRRRPHPRQAFGPSSAPTVVRSSLAATTCLSTRALTALVPWS